MEIKAPKWDLSRFYDSFEDLAIQNDIQMVLAKCDSFVENYKGKIATAELPAAEYKDMFVSLEEIYEIYSKLRTFASLSFSTDSKSQEANELYQRVTELNSTISSKIVFLSLELAELSDEAYEKIMNDPVISNYKHFTDSKRLLRTHLLSEVEEQIINLKKASGSDAMKKLYDELTSSFVYSVTLKGKEKELNGSEVASMITSADTEEREVAFNALFTKYFENQIACANIYNALAKDWDMDAKKRTYKKPISVRNQLNEVGDATVDTLVEVTTKNADLVERYYKLKAKLMGKEKIEHHDIYAPLSKVEKKYTWEEAKKTILKVMNSFDESAAKIIEGFFNENYIHGSIMPNKRSGAFCTFPTPELHPYVFVNFTGSQEDMMTLAHELGHGLHGSLSRKQTIVNCTTPLTMAETASVFSEMLMTDYLLKNMIDREEKIAFIASRLEMMFATTYRQNMFTRFEIRAHDAIANGYCSFEKLSDIYREELEIMFGESVEFMELSGTEWARIPHIYRYPFYCYAYNFAQLLVVAIYQKYLDEGKAFVPKYIELLSSGSFDSPEKLLSKLGIDLTDPNFWQRGFDFVEERFLGELEKLV